VERGVNISSQGSGASSRLQRKNNRGGEMEGGGDIEILRGPGTPTRKKAQRKGHHIGGKGVSGGA